MGKPRAYFNEIDKFAAQWLRNLISAGEIAPGDVDERSIEDVTPSDLAGYTQCHFFAGIGGWSLAARRAGWPDDRPLWTGSCPCQPFSAAGKGAGFADERHLWPSWYWLISQCHPDEVRGEQVAQGGGLEWFDLVATDLEREGYAVAASDIPAAGFGGWHIRQRLYFAGVADTLGQRGRRGQSGGQDAGHAGLTGQAGSVADAHEGQRGRLSEASGGDQQHGAQAGWQQGDGEPRDGGDVVWLPCRDGKYRPTESGIFPLAHGVSGRVGRLRAYGNAIHIPTAEAWLRATA